MNITTIVTQMTILLLIMIVGFVGAKKNIFNQDFSGNVFLIEVGGNNNNFNEVYNSVLALAEIIGNVIGSEN